VSNVTAKLGKLIPPSHIKASYLAAIFIGIATSVLVGSRMERTAFAVVVGTIGLFFLFIKLKVGIAVFLGIFLVGQQIIVFLGVGSAQSVDEVAVLLFLGVAVFRVVLSKSVLKKTPIDRYLIGFLLLAIISAYINQVPIEIATRGLYSTLKGLLMFYVGWYLGIRFKELDKFISFMIMIAVIISLISIIQFAITPQTFLKIVGLDGFSFTRKWGMPSLFSHPANAAYFIAFFASFAVAELILYKNRKFRTLLVLTLLSIGLILSNTRAAWFAWVGSIIIVMFLLRSRRGIRISVVMFVIFSIGIAILFMTSESVRTSLIHKYTSYVLSIQRYVFGTYQLTTGIDYRFFAFFDGLRILADNFWFGVGPGRYGGWVAYEFNSPIYKEYNVFVLGTSLAQSDNFWIHLLVESGILGFAFFVLILQKIYKGYLQLYHQHPDTLVKRLALGSLISFLFVVIVGFFSPILEGPPIPFYFWGIAGAMLSMKHQRQYD